MISGSFKSNAEIVNNLSIITRDFTPQNYPDGWTHFEDAKFGQFLLNSTVIAVLAVIGNALSCLFAAYAFARLRFRFRGFFFAIMIGTLLLPQHVLIIPQYIVFKEFDWVGTIAPLVVPHFLATEAFFVFLKVQFMRTIPAELDDAARMDGCGPFTTFRYVLLPLSRPALVTTAIFSFIWTWNEFFRQLVFLFDIEDYTVSVAMTLFIDSQGQSAIAPMFAMSVLSLLPVFVFFVAFQKLLVEGINTGGLKG
jgi:multiple sugar transport system permease protein